MEVKDLGQLLFRLKSIKSSAVSMFESIYVSMRPTEEEVYGPFRESFFYEFEDIRVIYDYLTLSVDMVKEENFCLPSSLSVPIAFNQLNPRWSLQEHLRYAQEGRLVVSNPHKQRQIETVIQSHSRGVYCRERIQNTQDARGHQLTLSYRRVCLKEGLQEKEYLVETIDDDSDAPENLIHLFVPDYSTKIRLGDTIGFFGNGALSYLDEADLLIYEVHRPEKSYQVLVQSGCIVGYDEITYRGFNGLVTHSFKKLGPQENCDYERFRRLANWKKQVRGIHSHKGVRVVVKVQGADLEDKVLNVDEEHSVSSEALCRDSSLVKVSLTKDSTARFEHSLFVCLQDGHGLFVSDVYENSDHFDKLFALVPSCWHSLLFKGLLTFKIRAPLIRDRSFFEWHHPQIYQDIQRKVALTFISYLAHSYLIDPDFVVTLIPEDMMTNYQYTSFFQNFYSDFNETDSFSQDQQISFCESLQVADDNQLVCLFLKMRIWDKDLNLTTLWREREKIFSNEKSVYDSWENKRNQLSPPPALTDFKVLRCGDLGYERYRVFATVLSQLTEPVGLYVFEDPRPKNAAYCGFSNLYLCSEVLNPRRYNPSQAWEVLCHEMTHFYEFRQEFLKVGESCYYSCSECLTHQSDGKFGTLYRFVSMELWRQLKRIVDDFEVEGLLENNPFLELFNEITPLECDSEALSLQTICHVDSSTVCSA